MCVHQFMMNNRGRNFRWEHFSQFNQSIKYLHWPLFINFEVMKTFTVLQEQLFAGDHFSRYWNLKKKELINQIWYHDKINMIFVCIILLSYFSRNIYPIFFEYQQHVPIHTCAQVRKVPFSHYGDDREDTLY